MKKFNRDNSGYTLVELLLTLVIFAVVMLGIGAIMRSTTVSYGNGLANVDMQQEAQIVANQIEEMFVDSLTKVTYDSANNYWYADGNYLRYDSTTQQIYYQKAVADPDASNWSLMADYVSNFDIDDTTATDNMVRVSVEMDNDGYVYNAVKEIYYRNNVEDQTTHNFDDTTPPGGDPDADEYTDVVILDRYEVLDLATQYNVDLTKPISLSDSCAGKYSFYTVGYASNNLYSPDTIDSISMMVEADIQTGFISTNTTLNGTPTSAVAESQACEVTATDMDGDPVKLCLTTDKVEYNFSTADTSSDGFVMFASIPGDSGRIMNWIDVKGMDVASYVNNFGGSITCYACAYSDENGDEKWTYVSGSDSSEEKKVPGLNANNNAKVTYTISKVSGADSLDLTNYAINYLNNGQGNSDRLQVAIGVDSQTGDIFIAQGNNTITDIASFNNGNIRIAMNFQINGLETKVVDMNVMCDQGDFSGYTGGNLYGTSECSGF